MAIPTASNPPDEPDKEGQCSSERSNEHDVEELHRRALERMEQEARDDLRELLKAAGRGGAFQVGKETAKRLWDLLTDHFDF